MKITLNIKKENLRSLLKILKRLDLLADDGIEAVEGMELAAVYELLNEESDVKSKESVIDVIQDYFAHSQLPVEKIWLFGSYAREEQHEQSDIDLVVRFKPESKIDLWDFAGIIQDLEDRLDRKVDLVREGGEKSFATSSIRTRLPCTVTSSPAAPARAARPSTTRSSSPRRGRPCPRRRRGSSAPRRS